MSMDTLRCDCGGGGGRGAIARGSAGADPGADNGGESLPSSISQLPSLLIIIVLSSSVSPSFPTLCSPFSPWPRDAFPSSTCRATLSCPSHPR